MKKTKDKKYTLAQLISIVSALTENDYEAGQVIADLINKGVVKLEGIYHDKTVKVVFSS